MADNILYTKEHEWIKLGENEIVMGITAYAANSLGDITFVETPSVGDKVEQTKVMGTVESIKAVSDIYAPISGKVSEVNPELESTPELVNQSPEERGWICKIVEFNKDEFQKLMTPNQYKEYLETLEQ